MKLVLIYPKFPISERVKFNVPINLLHLGTYMESRGVKVKLIDCNVEDDYRNILREEIKDAATVGVSSMTAQLPAAMDIVNFIRKNLNLNIPIIFGGVHPTLFPRQIVESSYINYAVIGEGELSLEYLFNSIVGIKQSEIQGNYAFIDKNKGFTFIQSQKVFDFSKMPNINYYLLNRNVLECFVTYSVGVLTSRGCPHRCAFCINTVRQENRKWRSWDAKRIVGEIEGLVKLGGRKIWFWDECFFVNKKRILEFIYEVEHGNIDFEWFAEVRADYFGEHFLDGNILNRLWNIGLRKVGIGAESGSQKILNYINKDIKVENLYTAAELCNAVQIQPSFSFMIGLPTETKHDIKDTIKIIGRLSDLCPKATFVGPQLYRPYPGAKLYDICVEYGWSEPKNISQWIDFISNKLMEADPYSMPWIRNPYYVNVAWFYGIMWAVGYKKFIKWFLQYCRMGRININLRMLGFCGITIIYLIGIIRRYLHCYIAPFEIKILKRYRSVLSV